MAKTLLTKHQLNKLAELDLLACAFYQFWRKNHNATPEQALLAATMVYLPQAQAVCATITPRGFQLRWEDEAERPIAMPTAPVIGERRKQQRGNAQYEFKPTTVIAVLRAALKTRDSHQSLETLIKEIGNQQRLAAKTVGAIILTFTTASEFAWLYLTYAKYWHADQYRTMIWPLLKEVLADPERPAVFMQACAQVEARLGLPPKQVYRNTNDYASAEELQSIHKVYPTVLREVLRHRLAMDARGEKGVLKRNG